MGRSQEHHPRARHLDLGEALGQRSRALPLDRGAGERLDADLVVSDVHEHRLVVVHAGEGARIGGLKSTFVVPHDVDAVEHTGLEVEPRVDAGAGGEGLEAKAVEVRLTTGSAAAIRAATMFGGS